MGIPVEQRRRLLAEAALRLIARSGVQAASVRAIAAEAGMSLASVHYAFESREELLRESVRQVVRGERAAAEAFLAGAGDGEDLEALVRGALASYAGLLREDAGREQAMLELAHHALRTPELDGVAQEQYDAYYRLVEELLAAAAERCGVIWATSLPVLARLVVAFTDGLTMQVLVSPDDEATDQQVALVARTIAAQAVAA